MPEINHERLPNKEAIASFGGKALLTAQHHAELKAYEHALAFTVARIADKDMLTEVHKAMKQAIENGTSFADFKKALKPYLMARGWLAPTFKNDNVDDDKETFRDYQKHLGHRLRTIYHTNKATAYAGGQWERIQRTKELLPYLQYMKSASTNKRDEHKQFYGMVRPVDDPIWASIMPPNDFGCKCWVKQLTKTRAEKILNEQAEKGIVYDIEMEEVKHPLTGEMMTVPKGVHFSFNHNHDRLTALLKLAEDKHGAGFVEKLGVDLKGEMVGYAVKGGITHIDFRGITPRVDEVARLEKELNGDVSPFEGVVADEWQQKFGVTLERFDPNIHKVLAYNTKTNTPKSADYAIVDLVKDPKSWVTIDLLFTMSEKQANEMAYQIFESKKKRHANAWTNVIKTIDEHLLKADIVPMDLRTLDLRIATKIIAYVLSLPKEKQKQIIFIKG
ncbi:phage minor head protein [Moraxella bovis]|uniref:phage minor head protein n=1 Tax=Moraxella bovis TaxID=476 RepID=UPI002226D1C3|nr:phage minor head protein [Moraxella bovis]UYZ94964.1 minor capsid protein [Moraxella bovis]